MGPVKAFRFGVSAYRARAASEWRDLARRLEATGYDTLSVPDHLDQALSPFPALAAAAAATTQLRLGTLVCNNDLRNPLVLAYEAATVDALSDGRLELGIGAGHAAPEYDRAGLRFDDAGTRVERMGVAVDIVARLFAAETVTVDGPHYTMREATVYPVPSRPPPILVGGWGRGVLRIAAERADIVGLTGLGRTRADGRHHEVGGFAAAAVDERLTYVRDCAAGRDVELHALVQAVVVSADRAAAAASVAERIEGLTPQAVLESPFVLVGTVDEIAADLDDYRHRWGISYFTVFEPFADALAPVVAALAR